MVRGENRYKTWYKGFDDFMKKKLKQIKKLVFEFVSTPSEAHSAGLGVFITVLMIFSNHYLPSLATEVMTMLWLGCVGVATGLFYMEELDAPFVKDIKKEGHYFIALSGLTILIYVFFVTIF